MAAIIMIMKYIEVRFDIAPYNTDVSDVLCALLADEGFEAFESTDHSLIAWIQQRIYSPKCICRAIDALPFSNVIIHYHIAEVPDMNWNKQWEENGFKPIIIYGKKQETSDALQALIVIHDTVHTDVPKAKYDICINPCQAFGTGSHETTRMILSQLVSMPMKGRFVIDAGTGTGILAIFCSMLGAEKIVAYDIDEWSVRNACENLALNGITQGVSILLGDSSMLYELRQSYGESPQPHSCVMVRPSLLIANINRNILLNDMSVFADMLDDGGELLLSGFYTTDIPILLTEANRVGFSLCHQAEEHEWAMLLLKKEKPLAQ